MPTMLIALALLAAPALVRAQPCPPGTVNPSSIAVAWSGAFATVSWQAAVGDCAALYYLVMIAYDPNAFPTNAAATDQLRLPNVFWNDEQPRYIRIRAVNNSGEGPPPTESRRFQRFFCTQRPMPPQNLRVLSHDETGTRIAWDAASVPHCTVTYLLTAAQSPGGGAGDLQWTATATGGIATGLWPGVRWYFRVYAHTDAGWSDESRYVDVDPLPLPPAPLPPPPNPCPVPSSPRHVQTLIADRTLMIAWEAPEDVCLLDGFWLTAELYPDGPRLGNVAVDASTRGYRVAFTFPVAFWLRVYVVRGGVLSLPSNPTSVVIP